MLSLDNVFGPEQLAKRAAALERRLGHPVASIRVDRLPQWQRPGLLCPLFVRGEVLSEADLAWVRSRRVVPGPGVFPWSTTITFSVFTYPARTRSPRCWAGRGCPRRRT
ncbi:hypothetical protein FHR33_008765 [Nonomuraea dietziae]|uniref:Uncharacterized protein n=1 Tax=Nonomuraea dietziae TaxID=65515 RepID=A0A7W5YFE3_9ACTN|nr:hypothetical protein [Nonomuraea dietziae]